MNSRLARLREVLLGQHEAALGNCSNLCFELCDRWRKPHAYVQKPFNLIFPGAKNGEWSALADDFRTFW